MINILASGGTMVKNPLPMQETHARDTGSIPGLGRCPGVGNGSPFQYSCFKIPWTEEPVGYSPQGHKE